MEQVRIVDRVIARHQRMAPTAMQWDESLAAEQNDKAIRTVIARWAEDLYPKLIDGTAILPNSHKFKVSLLSTTEKGLVHPCVVYIGYGNRTYATTPTMFGMRVGVHLDIPNATRFNLVSKILDPGAGDEAIGVVQFTQDAQIPSFSPRFYKNVFRKPRDEPDL